MKTGRPRTQWQQPTTAIRVPTAYADRLTALAHWWEAGGHAHAPDPFTPEAEARTRAHLDTYPREALIDEILAFRTDQDALWSRLVKEGNLQ
jgi:hypothetical protein